jgi:4-diphosphocytidyl-2-C-methyl-D-erythritol kinase
MISFPPCKINLGLQVTRKRPDGYHDLETCFYPVPWTDILEIIPSDEFSFTSSGSLIPDNGADNLCVKAYHLLKTAYVALPPARIHLHKIIPMGAGLGGGSADAAYTLRGLNQLFELKLSVNDLMKHAAQLGSDCAFFVQDDAMIGSGRGEVLEPVTISLQGKFVVITKPPIHVSTAEAYADIIPRPPALSLRDYIEREPMTAWKHVLKNDFEEHVFKKYPAIQSVKETLYAQGAVYASMSGSGAAVFGIFTEEKDLQMLFPGHEYWGGVIH